MALAIKERVRRPVLATPVNVEVDATGDPLRMVYKDPKWDKERALEVIGVSNSDDITDRNIKLDTLVKLIGARQYILCDDDANMYEAYIEISKTARGFVGTAKGFKTIPSE